MGNYFSSVSTVKESESESIKVITDTENHNVIVTNFELKNENVQNGDLKSLVDCVRIVFEKGFSDARTMYNQKAPDNFRIFRGIIHTFLQRGSVKNLISFVRMNISEHGLNPKMLLMMAKGFLLFPIQYLLNRKRKL